jgi:hypothetical protein
MLGVYKMLDPKYFPSKIKAVFVNFVAIFPKREQRKVARFPHQSTSLSMIYFHKIYLQQSFRKEPK